MPKSHGKRRKSKKTVLLDGKGNTTVLRESFRTIRTRVTKNAEENGIKSLIVTSAISDEGKTTVAVNLAISLAKKGKKLSDALKKLNHIFSGGMYGGKNTLIRASVDRREACSPDVRYNPKSLLFGLQ